MTQAIHTVLITGGTHGNELSGVQALENWLKNPTELTSISKSLSIQFELVNKKAIVQNRRYVDEDLNRQFTLSNLSEDINDDSPYEVSLAHRLNKQYGPKGESSTDFVIDIHNTTSNMGPTLIILENDGFHQQLARYVKDIMPEAIILIEDYQAFSQFGYLCTLGRQGVMIEIGPQAQGTLKAIAYQQAVQMTQAILSFIDLFNQNKQAILEPVEAFRLGTEISYPLENGNKSAMIHPNLDGQDFQLLRNGDPCFIDFNGKDITWTKEDTYPHFIGEAAYHHLHIAFATSSKILW